MKPEPFRVRTGGEVETINLGRRIGVAIRTTARAGFSIGLTGPIGAGKTQLAKGIVRGVHPTDDLRVVSPTYGIMHEHGAEPCVLHVDLYRLSSDDDLESVGFWDVAGESIAVIEWPERIERVAATLDARVVLEPAAAENERDLALEALTAHGRAVLRAFGEGSRG